MTNHSGLFGTFSADIGTVPCKPGRWGLGLDPRAPSCFQSLYPLPGRRLSRVKLQPPSTTVHPRPAPPGGPHRQRILEEPSLRAPRGPARAGDAGAGTHGGTKRPGRGSFENTEEVDLGPGPRSDEEGGSEGGRAGIGRPQSSPASSGERGRRDGRRARRPRAATPRTLPPARRLRGPALQPDCDSQPGSRRRRVGRDRCPSRSRPLRPGHPAARAARSEGLPRPRHQGP